MCFRTGFINCVDEVSMIRDLKEGDAQQTLGQW
jgi:hypothetical protein